MGQPFEDMSKAGFVGRYECPETINGAYELLVRTSRQFGGSILRGGRRNFRNERGCGDRSGVIFTQTRGDRGERKSTSGINLSQGDPVTGKDVQLYRHTECYACHCYGNFSGQFQDRNLKAINLAIIGVMLIKNGGVIKKTWILLDTCSTYSVTNNLDYVEDVKNCAKDEELTVLTNEGSLLFDRTGTLSVMHVIVMETFPVNSKIET